ncbi:MAG: hypothetical protein R3C45_15575 [Phycisphaerales bacterium]
MPDPDRTPDTPRSRKIFWIKLLSTMAAILLGTFVLYRVVAYRALNQRIEAVRASGYPIEPEELNAWYPMPEGENAADVYDARSAIPADDKSEGVPVVSTIAGYVPGQPLDEEMAGADRGVPGSTPTCSPCSKRRPSSARPFPLDFKDGFSVLLPELGPLRRGTHPESAIDLRHAPG